MNIKQPTERFCAVYFIKWLSISLSFTSVEKGQTSLLEIILEQEWIRLYLILLFLGASIV